MINYLDIRLILRASAFYLFIVYGEACFGGAAPGFYGPQYGPVYSAPYVPYSAASKTRMASPSHTLTSANSLDDLQPVSECTVRFANQKLGCVQSFEKRVPSTEQECQQICEEYTTKCRAYQFDTLMSQCELFDVDQHGQHPNLDDTLDGSYRHKRYASKNPFDEFLRDPLRMISSDSQTVYCEPALVPNIGTNYVQTDYNCRMASIQAQPPPAPTFQAKSVPNSMARMSNQMLGPDCAEGSSARIQLIDGIELVQAKPVLTVQLDSPDACLHICRLNTHLDGTQFPRSCKSSSFDRSSGRCYIFESAISPNGDLNYMPNSNSIYFEKFCIPNNELPAHCDDVIHRIPQHTLDRRASGTGAIVTASTQINCIRHCISAVRELGFECMSASYFFDWPSENCYLSRFTRISRPDIYVAERKQFVDYIEMAKCDRKNWQHDQAPSSWSEWSRCDETMTRTRHRNCTDCKQRKESVPCLSESGFQRDLPKSPIEAQIETKKIAKDFESARRYKEPSKVAEEASLFGEHDYENQHEISFFGPPHPDESKKTEDENTSLFQLQSNIRPIDTIHPSPFKDFEVNEETVERRRKESTSKHDQLTQNNEEDVLLKKALQEAEENLDKSDPKSIETTTAISECDPKIKCCPRLGTNEKSARLRGCVIGYKMDAEGHQVACITEEYCTKASNAADLPRKLNYVLFIWLLAFMNF